MAMWLESSMAPPAKAPCVTFLPAAVWTTKTTIRTNNLPNGPLRPSHICLLTLLFFVAPAIQQGHASGLQTKTAVQITADPHYQLLMANEQVRVYSLVLPPGAESFVRHEHNYLTVTLADCNPIFWKNDESPIQHFQVPIWVLLFFLVGLAHAIRKDSIA